MLNSLMILSTFMDEISHISDGLLMVHNTALENFACSRSRKNCLILARFSSLFSLVHFILIFDNRGLFNGDLIVFTIKGDCGIDS